MWYLCDVLYVVLYVCVSCCVMLSREGIYLYIYIYIYVCNYDMFSVVNVYLDHL